MISLTDSPTNGGTNVQPTAERRLRLLRQSARIRRNVKILDSLRRTKPSTQTQEIAARP